MFFHLVFGFFFSISSSKRSHTQENFKQKGVTKGHALLRGEKRSEPHLLSIIWVGTWGVGASLTHSGQGLERWVIAHVRLFSTRTFLQNSVLEYVGPASKQNNRVQLILLINCKILPGSWKCTMNNGVSAALFSNPLSWDLTLIFFENWQYFPFICLSSTPFSVT